MSLKLFLLIYILCGFAMCCHIKQGIDHAGGWAGVYDAAHFIDPSIEDKLKKYDLKDPKMQILFFMTIALLWPIFIPNVFNNKF